MKQAVAAFATRRHALAQHQPVALEGQKIGLAPRRVVEMNARGRLTCFHFGAEIDQRLEQPAVRGIDVVVVATDLGEQFDRQGMEELKKAGVTYVVPDKGAFETAWKDVYKSYEGTAWPTGLVDRIKAAQK